MRMSSRNRSPDLPVESDAQLLLRQPPDERQR